MRVDKLKQHQLSSGRAILLGQEQQRAPTHRIDFGNPAQVEDQLPVSVVEERLHRFAQRDVAGPEDEMALQVENDDTVAFSLVNFEIVVIKHIGQTGNFSTLPKTPIATARFR